MSSRKNRNKLGRNLGKKRENDKIDKKTRSSLMSKIHSKNTKFENEFIDKLQKILQIPFEKNVKDIRGKPDVVFNAQKVCVFLDSDFWHGWQYPRWKHLLKNDFWRKKIQNNRKRDKNTSQYLRRHGWKVVRIWGHQIRDDIKKQIFRIKQELLE